MGNQFEFYPGQPVRITEFLGKPETPWEKRELTTG